MAAATTESVAIKLSLFSSAFKRDMRRATKSMKSMVKDFGGSINNLSSSTRMLKQKLSKDTRLETKQYGDSMKRRSNAVSQYTKNLSSDMNAHVRAQKNLFNMGQKSANMANTNRLANSSLSDVFRMNIDTLNKFNQSGGRFNRKSAKMANGFRQLTHGAKGFQMAALGVMFFGMGMQKMFTGLLKPAADMFGIFELFSMMLAVLFLPIMEDLMPHFIRFIKFFIDLPVPIQKVIGVFVIIGAVIGGFLFVLGQLVLGVGSLIIFFGLFEPVIAAVGTFFIGLSATVLAVIAAIVLVVVGMFVAWKENFIGMKTVVSTFINGLKRMFSGLVDVFRGFSQFFEGILSGDWKKAWEGAQLIVSGFNDFVTGQIETLVSGIGAIAIGIVRLFKIPIDLVVGLFKAMPDSIKNLGSTIMDAFLGLFPLWMRDGIKSGGKILLDIGGNIAGAASGALSSIFTRHNDFVWRPGQGAISINPNDTLVGFKGAPPNIGGGGGGIVQNNTFNGFTLSDLERALDSRDRRLVDDIRRLSKA